MLGWYARLLGDVGSLGQALVIVEFVKNGRHAGLTRLGISFVSMIRSRGSLFLGGWKSFGTFELARTYRQSEHIGIKIPRRSTYLGSSD